MSSFIKQRLVCPGPTPLLDAAQTASFNKNIYHRSDSFKQVVLDCRKMLKDVFLGENLPLILTSSGTGAMEASFVNFTSPEDKVAIISGGKFGQRWQQLAESYDCQASSFELEWGKSVDLEVFKEWISNIKDLKSIFFQANETSTGVAYPVKEICDTVKEQHPDCLIIVDAISALLAQELPQKELGIDVLISGSQKGFGLPAGLSFVSLSNRALNSFSNRSCFYFNLQKEYKGQANGTTSWTPATALILSLKETLHRLLEIGLDNFIKNHKQMTLACRSAIRELHLEPLATEDFSYSLTSVKVPSSINGKELLRVLREKYKAFFAGGQDQLNGKIIRIAHLGFVDEFNLIENIAILEFALKDLGWEFNIGVGVAAAMKELYRKDT